MAHHQSSLLQRRPLLNVSPGGPSSECSVLLWLHYSVSPRIKTSWRPCSGKWQQKHSIMSCKQFEDAETSCPSNPLPRIRVRYRGARAHGFNRAICEPTFVPKVGQRRQGCLLKATSQCSPVRTRHARLLGAGRPHPLCWRNSSSKRSAGPLSATSRRSRIVTSVHPTRSN